MYIYTVTYLNHNYGSILQAFALQNRFRELGASPIILQRRQTVRKSSLFVRILKLLKPKKNYTLVDRVKLSVQKKDFKEKNKKLDIFIEKYLNVRWLRGPEDIVHELKEDDVLVAGSDQIWSMIYGLVPDWYTFNWDGLPFGIRKFSYAASIGLAELTEEQKNFYREKLNEFKIVSIREEQAVALLKPYFDKRIRCDLDPTLLYGDTFWSKVCSERRIDKPYIFVYMLRPDIKIIDMARTIAKKRNLEVIYTGLLSDKFAGVQTICDAGIEDFLSLIKNADIVLTNSFHGTVFSVLFRKNFLSVKLASTSSRVENLLEKIGISDRLIIDRSGLYKIDEPINYESALKLLEQERANSLEYIKEIVCKRK